MARFHYVVRKKCTIITMNDNDARINDNNTKMIRVILESPYAGDVDRNIEYARRCVNDSLHHNEAPIASHLLYTQKGVLDDNIDTERQLGIGAGLEWLKVADMHVFYVDYGSSDGMRYAFEYSKANLNIPIEFRKILTK